MGTTPRNATSGQVRELKKQVREAIDELGLTFDQAAVLLRKGGAFKGKVKDTARQLLSTDLLEFVTSANVEASERFSVADLVKTGRIGGVRFWFSENFKRVFGTLVETDIPAMTLRSHQLKKGSVDGPILEELGGTEQARVFIAHLFALACRQGQGQEGFLLTNGWANVAYAPDPNDPETFWAVNFRRYASGGRWDVYAYPVAGPVEWCAVNQVLSR